MFTREQVKKTILKLQDVQKMEEKLKKCFSETIMCDSHCGSVELWLTELVELIDILAPEIAEEISIFMFEIPLHDNHWGYHMIWIEWFTEELYSWDLDYYLDILVAKNIISE